MFFFFKREGCFSKGGEEGEEGEGAKGGGGEGFHEGEERFKKGEEVFFTKGGCVCFKKGERCALRKKEEVCFKKKRYVFERGGMFFLMRDDLSGVAPLSNRITTTTNSTSPSHPVNLVKSHLPDCMSPWGLHSTNPDWH